MNPERPLSALEKLQRLELEKRDGATAVPQGAAAAPWRGRSSWGWLLAGLLLTLGKLKFILAGLKFLSFGKLMVTSSTMLLAIVVYAQFYGWRFAAGFVLLILLHELGHGLAARIQGIKVGAPVFIPFFGAFIALKERPKTPYQDFFIGAGGPLAGSAGGLACVLLSQVTPGTWGGLLYAVGYFALWLNLFNLFPVWQLDGARMTAPVSAGAWRAGFVLLLLVVLSAASTAEHLQPMPLILLALVGFRALQTFSKKSALGQPQSALARLEAAEARAHTERGELVSESQRMIAAGVYFGLAAGLVYLTHVLAAGLPKT